MITLKALLTPSALASLEPAQAHRFCPERTCEVVYFSPLRRYRRAEVKVPVYQKDPAISVPVCSCFGQTRADLKEAHQQGRGQETVETIQQHIKAGRCGCEVNNPQGRCCLGNVTRALAELAHQPPEGVPV